jgi:amino acid transporter
LQRRIGLRSAVLFNMLEMIGVGPFITLPLVIAAAGYRLSVWAWVLGAAIAVADGLVWAELGASFPRAGGSYAFHKREIYGPDRAGQLAELSLRVAVELFGPAVHRFGVHRTVEVFWRGSGPALELAVPVAALPALALFQFCGSAVLVCWSRRCSIATSARWRGMAWVHVCRGNRGHEPGSSSPGS